MAKKLLLNIVIANLLWSFIPIVVSDLFAEISIIMILFLRFLIAGIVLIVIAVFIIIFNNRFSEKKKIKFKLIFGNLNRRNRRFFDARTYVYYMLLGFVGIILQVIFFFLALKTTSITFTMVGFLLCIVIIAFYDKGVNFEKFDIFKILYIILLGFSAIILISVSVRGASLEGTVIPLNGILYMIIFGILISFLYIAINLDNYSRKEAKLINVNRMYKIPRFLVKMGLSFLFGVTLMVPTMLILALIPLDLDLTTESRLFFEQILSIWEILGRWEILYLIIFATIIPYLLVFIANVYWSSESLTYSQWSSILNLVDPMGSLIFSVIILGEYFPYELLLIVIFVLIITIILRYAHEVKNLVKAFLLLTLKKGVFKKLPTKVLKYYGVKSVHNLVGTYDLLIEVKVSSIKDFFYLIDNRLKPLEGIKKIEILFVNKIEILSH